MFGVKITTNEGKDADLEYNNYVMPLTEVKKGEKNSTISEEDHK
jgi:hypothetical protein